MARQVSDDSARIIRSYDNSPFPPIMIARERSGLALLRRFGRGGITERKEGTGAPE